MTRSRVVLCRFAAVLERRHKRRSRTEDGSVDRTSHNPPDELMKFNIHCPGTCRPIEKM